MSNVIVARAKQFRPQHCLYRISWPRKPTHRIKHRVASCHTAEVISIRRLTCPTPCTNGTTDHSRGWWDRTMFGMDALAYSQRLNLLCFFSISLALWNGGAKSVHVGSTNWRKLGVFALKFLGDTYKHPTGHINFRTYCIVWQRFAKIGSGRRKICGQKKDRITRVKYNSFAMAKAIHRRL